MYSPKPASQTTVCGCLTAQIPPTVLAMEQKESKMNKGKQLLHMYIAIVMCSDAMM